MGIQIQKPSKGRIVEVNRAGKSTPAVVTNVFEGGRINAAPFLDGANDAGAVDHYYTIDHCRTPDANVDVATWRWPVFVTETIEVAG